MNKKYALSSGLYVLLFCLVVISLFRLFSCKHEVVLQNCTLINETEPYNVILSQENLNDEFVLQYPNNFTTNGFCLTIPNEWPVGIIGVAGVGELPQTNVGAIEEFHLPDNTVFHEYDTLESVISHKEMNGIVS